MGTGTNDTVLGWNIIFYFTVLFHYLLLIIKSNGALKKKMTTSNNNSRKEKKVYDFYLHISYYFIFVNLLLSSIFGINQE